MDAIELFSAPAHERRALQKKFPDITYSRAYLDLISLENLCVCRLQRRKVKEQTLLHMADNILYLPSYFAEYHKTPDELDSIPDELGSEGAQIPSTEQLRAQYIATLKSVGSIPQQLEALYQDAISCKGTQGRPKVSKKEDLTRSFYAGALLALVHLEKNFSLGIFPLRTRKEANEKFCSEVLVRQSATGHQEGGKSIFQLHLKKIENELEQAKAILSHWHEEGLFSKEKFITRYTGRLPGKEAGASWLLYVLTQRIWTHW